MSLDQHIDSRNRVIDLTNGPVIDLTKASFYSEDRAALEEAANRLLLTMPNAHARTGYVVPTAARPGYVLPTPDWTPAPRVRHASINVATILMITAIAAVGIMLLGLITTAG